MENISILLLPDGTKLLTQIEEVMADIGEPDCKLVEPFVINKDKTLTPWLLELTNQNTFMMHSDKILTMCEPNGKLKDNYETLVKG